MIALDAPWQQLRCDPDCLYEYGLPVAGFSEGLVVYMQHHEEVWHVGSEIADALSLRAGALDAAIRQTYPTAEEAAEAAIDALRADLTAWLIALPGGAG